MRWLTRLLIVVMLLVMVPGIHAQTDISCEDLGPAAAMASYFVGLGDAYFAQGNYALTTIAYTCAIERDSAYVMAYVNRGYAYVAQQDYEQALADYNRALEIDERLVPAYNNRGLLYTAEGNFGLAITDFTLAVSFDPGYAPAFHNRGVVHAVEGNYDLAIDDLEQAILLDPAFNAPHAALGAVYSAMAMASYQRYLDMSGDNARLPAGEPDSILLALGDSIRSQNYTIWLPFMSPAR